jgi:hypothetical protein
MQKAISWLRNSKLTQIFITAGILLVPVVLYCIPFEWVQNQHSICLYKNITGNECIGCGMTRAILSAMHFQFESAYFYNKLVVIVCPLLIYIWIKEVINKIFNINTPRLNQTVTKIFQSF